MCASVATRAAVYGRNSKGAICGREDGEFQNKTLTHAPRIPNTADLSACASVVINAVIHGGNARTPDIGEYMRDFQKKTFTRAPGFLNPRRFLRGCRCRWSNGSSMQSVLSLNRVSRKQPRNCEARLITKPCLRAY